MYASDAIGATHHESIVHVFVQAGCNPAQDVFHVMLSLKCAADSAGLIRLHDFDITVLSRLAAERTTGTYVPGRLAAERTTGTYVPAWPSGH